VELGILGWLFFLFQFLEVGSIPDPYWLMSLAETWYPGTVASGLADHSMVWSTCDEISGSKALGQGFL
jgi:hypothetical protein